MTQDRKKYVPKFKAGVSLPHKGVIASVALLLTGGQKPT